MIKEDDFVVLTEDLPKERLKAGDIGNESESWIRPLAL
jgi:hypothetical protein